MTQIRKTQSNSLWWAVIGIIAGATALYAHPMLSTNAVRIEVITSLIADIEDYLVFAIGAFGLFWIALHRWLAKRQISRRRWPRLSQIGNELAFSISSQIVMGAAGLYIMVSTPQIMGNIMISPDWLGWLWVMVLTFLLFLLEDAAFYWTHRAIHHPRLFRHIHGVHHDSHDPTPFTSFSFHPLEAVVQVVNGMPMIIALTILPWHPAAMVVYGFGQIGFNIIGHLGYEVYPARWHRLPVLRWKTPGFHHYLHHQLVGGNYALYFRWWDRWCGTEFADYEARYDRIFAPASAESGGQIHTLSTHA